jgi:hypothetical protein
MQQCESPTSITPLALHVTTIVVDDSGAARQ